MINQKKWVGVKEVQGLSATFHGTDTRAVLYFQNVGYFNQQLLSGLRVMILLLFAVQDRNVQ